MEILFLIGRILFGGFFVMTAMSHFTKSSMLAQYAASKHVPSAKFAVLVTGTMLLIGGLGILLGVFVKLAVAALVIFLLTAAFKMHAFWAIQDPDQKMTQMLFFLRNIALSGAALMMLAIPQPWQLSLGL